MKSDTFINLQKKFGGMWVATSKSGTKVYAAAKKVEKVFDELQRKKIASNKTVIGYIQEHGRIHIYLSLPVHRN